MESLFSELNILNKYKVSNSLELYETKKKEILSNLDRFNLDEIKENRTPLLYAIEFKHNLEDFTEEFVNTGKSNPGYIPSNSPTANTALINSISNKLEKVAFAILRTGEGKPEYANIDGNTALLCAVSNKYEELAIEIIKTGKSNPGVPYTKRGMTTTPLMSAINLKLIKVALEIAKTGQSNPSYIIKDENALTLAYFSHNDKTNFKQVMLEIIRTGDEKCLGFVPRNRYGNSVLMLFLLNEKLSHGWRDSHRQEDNTDIIDLTIELIRSGYSNPAHINNDGNTALMIACENKLNDIAIELINTGNSNAYHVNSESESTALMIACEKRMDDVAIAILRTGDSNYKYGYFDNALSIAVENDLDEVVEEIKRLDTIGIRGFSERLKSDPVFNKFNTLISEFNHKENTIKNKSEVIGDNLIKDITNPYLVHYEEFEGKSYPIITILKGTILFTARKLESPSISESYYHLYKLHNNPTLEDYTKDNLENVLTYFFPVPHISHYVLSNYITMDMVVLTKDVRLLCVMSPSPLCRDIKLNSDLYTDPNGLSKYYKNDDINACPTRGYDLCISKHLITGLKLNGYIGIAHDDSMTKHFKIEPNFKSSELFLSGCFNNAIYPQKAGKDFIENMVYNRTYGIPEVVLIPYDLHTHSDPSIYENVYSTWSNSLQRKHLNEEDGSHFIFKYVDQVNGKNSIDIGKNMAQRLSLYDGTTKPKIEKSLQAYPLLNVFAEEVEERNKDYVVGYKQITFDDIAFTSSYIESPRSKCAFETNTFYVELEKLVSNTSGGSVDIQNISIPSTSGYKEIPMKKPLIASKTKINKTQKTYSKKYPIDTEDIYYNEVNRVPIVVYKTNKLVDMSEISRVNAGGSKKSRTKNRRKTKKTKNTNRKRTQKH